MQKISRIFSFAWEPALWAGFLYLSFVSLQDSAPNDAPTIAGLFALAAIGVRATRLTDS